MEEKGETQVKERLIEDSESSACKQGLAEEGKCGIRFGVAIG